MKTSASGSVYNVLRLLQERDDGEIILKKKKKLNNNNENKN